MLQIQEHPDWLSRDLTDDFGIDAEAELTEHGVSGEILKLQFKSSAAVVRSEKKVQCVLERKYLDYANQCRYPVVLVVVDTTSKEAWYVWLQDWILEQRCLKRDVWNGQKSFTIWIDESKSLLNGLGGNLKDVAKWRGSTQLILSLLDALHAAIATQSKELTTKLVQLVAETAPDVASTTLDIVIEEAVYLGDRLRGTCDGLFVSDHLFGLVRRFGGHTTAGTVDRMVRRAESYSRTGLSALGILYDEHFDHAIGLSLVDMFMKAEHNHIAYYCALREKHPTKRCLDFIFGPGDFRFAGLRFQEPDEWNFSDKYANKGPSAILDYLHPE